MNTSLTFVLGIIVGIVIGFVIFTTTPLGLRYEYIPFGTYSYVKYNRWNGNASILSGTVIEDKFKRSTSTGLWAPLPSASKD